jgi:hypothetical protein
MLRYIAFIAALLVSFTTSTAAQTVTIKTNDGGFYLTAEEGGGPQGVNVNGRPTGLLVANRTVPDIWEQFTIEPTDDPERIALKSFNGFYVAAENRGGGIAVANRTAIGDWEKWKPVPKGDGGYALQAINGEYLRAEGGGGGEINVRGPDDSAWQTFYPSSPFIRGPPQGGTDNVARIFGQLRLEAGGGFVDDLGPVLPVCVHYGDAFSAFVRDPGGVLATLDDIARAGWPCIRFWSTLGGDSAFWAGRGVGPRETPDYYGKLEAFLNALKARGLTAHFAQGDLRPNVIENRAEFARRIAEIIGRVGPSVVALFEGLNEARDTGEPDVERLAQFVQWFRDARPEPIVALSAYTGTEDPEVLNRWSRSPADVFVVHSYRDGHWWDKVRHIYNVRYDGHPTKRIGWNGEGPGVGFLVSASQNKDEIDADVYAGLAAASLITRQGYVWFTGAGVINGAPDRLQDQPGFWTLPAQIRAAIPADVMRYSAGEATFVHGGDRWAGFRVFRAQGEVRADHVLHREPDGTYRFVVLIYGPGSLDVPQDKQVTIFSDTRFGNKVRIVYGRTR